MIVERLYLENVRRFDLLDLQLARRLNVIVGVNGAGKSTVLNAIAKEKFAKAFPNVALCDGRVGRPRPRTS